MYMSKNNSIIEYNKSKQLYLQKLSSWTICRIRTIFARTTVARTIFNRSLNVYRKKGPNQGSSYIWFSYDAALNDFQVIKLKKVRFKKNQNLSAAKPIKAPARPDPPPHEAIGKLAISSKMRFGGSITTPLWLGEGWEVAQRTSENNRRTLRIHPIERIRGQWESFEYTRVLHENLLTHPRFHSSRVMLLYFALFTVVGVQ